MYDNAVFCPQHASDGIWGPPSGATSKGSRCVTANHVPGRVFCRMRVLALVNEGSLTFVDVATVFQAPFSVRCNSALNGRSARTRRHDILPTARHEQLGEMLSSQHQFGIRAVRAEAARRCRRFRPLRPAARTRISPGPFHARPHPLRGHPYRPRGLRHLQEAAETIPSAPVESAKVQKYLARTWIGYRPAGRSITSIAWAN